MGGKANDIVIMRTCYALSQAGHSVHVITGKPVSARDIFSYYGIKPVPEMNVVQVPMLRGRPLSWHGVFNFFCLLKILGLKRKGMADIIYLREIKLARFLLKFRRILGLPFVIEIHTLRAKKFFDSSPEINRSEQYVFQNVNGIVVLLHTLAQFLKEIYHVRNTPIIKVPHAAEKAPFTFTHTGEHTVCYIGQLYPLQGVEILIEAMEYLDNARLCIIGGTPKDVARLKNLATVKNVDKRIDFHGFVEPRTVIEKARRADVMVICALNKGDRRYAAHTKLYEYMAMGKPIVAVDLPSIREEVQDRENILLVAPEDPKSLAEGIAEILDNPELAEHLAVNAYAAADEFSWEKKAAKLSKFFQHIYADYYEKH
jgi:glycosyltransferase involved in cell wall biosynthesis